MLTKEDIRYSRTWVRVIVVWSVTAMVSFLTCFRFLVPLEEALTALIVPEQIELYGRVHLFFEVESLFLFSLLAGWPRIRNPFFMVLYVTAILFAYLAFVILVFYIFNVILPMASLLITVIATGTVLGTLAWHEEQYNLRHLQDLEKMHQQLTDMLVHDLKKKLSSLMLSIGMLKHSASEKDAELLETLRTSSEQMLLLVTNLLDIRKLEVGRIALKNDSISLNQLLEKSADEHQSVADMLGVSLKCSADSETSIYADRQMISRVIMNLVWNAIQHAAANSQIEMSCGMEDELAYVRVANRGAVIPAEIQVDLFKPFRSGNNSVKGLLSDSTGLGLAFCKLAVEAHSGSIDLESPWQEHGDGVIVTVKFGSRSPTLQ